METIQLDNRDFGLTIDTYSVFNYHSEVEQSIERYNEEHKTNYDYNDFEWEYKNNDYRKGLAEQSIEFIKEYGDEVIVNVEYISSRSPREYNYTTDSYVCEIEYDKGKLLEWFGDLGNDKQGDYAEFREGYDCGEYEKILCYYINELKEEGYIDYMFDEANELAYECVGMVLINNNN